MIVKISIRIDISPEISIFLPSADAPVSPPLFGRVRPCKRNAPICDPTSTLITFKFVDRRRPPRCTASSSRHSIYGSHRLHIATATSNALVQTLLHWTSVPLILNATKVKIGLGGNGQKPRKIGGCGVIFYYEKKNRYIAILSIFLVKISIYIDTKKNRYLPLLIASNSVPPDTVESTVNNNVLYTRDHISVILREYEALV